MKKFLSLALALVMALSLVTISAGAKEFEDDSSVKYEEAVAVISEIGVVDGYSDGTFKPQNTLTRGAAAKIICNMILGPTTAAALPADTAPFKDVPASHEFAGYISYCAKEGIINGYSDGTFRPAETLNGYSFMKMLLGALGYDGTIEGFTGPNWTTNVAKLALGNGIDLADGNDEFVGSEAVTREEACLYAFNTLKADMVEYDSKTSVNVGDTTVVIDGSKAKKIKQSDSGYKDTMEPDTNKDDQVLQFAEKYFDKLTKTDNGTDPFGRPANEWKYKSNTIGTYADCSDLLQKWEGKKATKGEMYSLIGSSVIDDIFDNMKDDGSFKDNSEYTITVYVDGEEIDIDAKAEAKLFDKNSTSAAGVASYVGRGAKVGETGNGVVSELFMDDDNNVTFVIIHTYLVQASSDYNSAREQVTVEPIDVSEQTGSDNRSDYPNMDTTIELDDFDVSEVKEDDYLLVTWSIKEDEYESVEPATLKTGTVTQYTTRDNIVMDGETLKYNRLVGDQEQEEQYSINSDATVVLDAYGYILYVDDANSTNSYVYVKNITGKTNLNKDAVADAYFADGTSAEIDIKKVYTADGNSYDSGKTILANAAAPGWFTYTKDSSDQYTLTAVKGFKNTSTKYQDTIYLSDNDGDNAKLIVESSRVKFVGTYKGAVSKETPKANSKTVFLTLDADDELDIYEGVANSPDVTAVPNDTVIAYVMDTDGYAKYVFIDVSKDANSVVDGANSVADYMMVLWDNGKTTYVDGDEYRQYQVIIDGEETTRYIDSSLVGGDAKATGCVFYDIKTNSSGYITDSTKQFGVDDSKKAEHVTIDLDKVVITQKSGSIAFDSDAYLADSKTEVYLNVLDSDLMKNSGNDYESYVKTTIGTIAGLCKDYLVSGTAYIVLDSDDGDSDRADYLFVNIKDAVKSGEVVDEPDEPVTPEEPMTVNVTCILQSSGATLPGDTQVFEEAEADENGKVTVKAPEIAGYTAIGGGEIQKDFVAGKTINVTFTYTVAEAE